ncbi:hypothetical protein AMTRI_Chr05g70440 [Amborella trichopoda]
MARSIPNSHSVQIPPLICPRRRWGRCLNSSTPTHLMRPGLHPRCTLCFSSPLPPFLSLCDKLSPFHLVSYDYSPPPCGAPLSKGSTLSPYSSRFSPTSSLSHSMTSIDSTRFHDLLRAQDFINADLVASSTTKIMKSKRKLDNLLAFGANFNSGLLQTLTPRPSSLNHSTSATPSQLPSC